VSVSRRDFVVLGSEVGAGDNEVHVEVGVVVLLELDRMQLDCARAERLADLADQLVDILALEVAVVSALRLTRLASSAILLLSLT